MDQEFIKQMKQQLLAEKKKIEDQLKNVSKDDKGGRFPGDAEAKFPDYGDSAEENADEVITYQENLSTSSNLDGYLDEIEAAIERIDEGKYGVCGKCGLEIRPDRLKVFPAAKICMDCTKEK